MRQASMKTVTKTSVLFLLTISTQINKDSGNRIRINDARCVARRTITVTYHLKSISS